MSIDVTVVSNGGQIIEVSVGEGAAVLDAIGAQVEALAGEAAARTAADTAIVGGADTNNDTLKKLGDRVTIEIPDAVASLKGGADTNNDTLDKLADRITIEIPDAVEALKGGADTNNDTFKKLSDRITIEIPDAVAVLEGGADPNNNTLGKLGARVDGVKFRSDDVFAQVQGWQTPAYTVETGFYYRTSSGAKVSSAGYKVIKVDLTGGEGGVRVSATVTGADTGLAVFFDAAGTFISAQYPGSSSTDVYANQVLTVPPAARSVGITGVAAQAISLQILKSRPVATELDALASGVSANASGLAVASSKAGVAYDVTTSWVRSTITVVAGYFRAANGAAAASASYKRATIALTGGEVAIRVSATLQGADAALACYYDAGGAFISSETIGTGSPIVYTNKVLAPPATARTVGISGVSTGLLVFDILTARDLNALETKANAGQLAVASLTTWQASGATNIAGYYVSSTGSLVANAGYQYLDYTIDGGELDYRATGTGQGAATALATYVDGTGAVLGRQFVGTGTVTTYTDQALTVPTGTVKIRLCGFAANALSLSIYRVMTNIAASVLALMAGSVTPLRKIAVVGDSMALALAPNIATLFPSRSVSNQGIGGETIAHISARMGGKQILITVAGGQIPTSGTVNVTLSLDLLYAFSAPAVSSCRIAVLGVLCKLVRTTSTAQYTLEAITTLSAPVNIAANTPIQVISGEVSSADPTAAPSLDTILSGIVVVRAGRNDSDGMSDPTQRTAFLADIATIVAQVTARGGKLLICTPTNGNWDLPTGMATGASVSTAALSQARLAGKAAFNAALLAAWPDFAIDPQANHISQGGSTSRTVNGQTFDVLDQPTLHTDGLHESADVGVPRTAALVKAYIDLRGW